MVDFWHFPQDIVSAIRDQEQPLRTEPLSHYAACIHLAQYMLDNENKIKEGFFDDFPVKLAHALQLKLTDLYALLENAPEMDEGIEDFLA